MGQRLNIEIKEKGKVIANAYYHWSAYTGSSMELVKTIINKLDTINYDNSIVRAIKLLETTGSGLDNDELRFVNKYIPNAEKYNFAPTTGRNDGLTAVSEEGIEETEMWEEQRVEINIDTKRILFDVLWVVDKEEYLEEYSDNGYDCGFNDIPTLSSNINIKDMSFDEFMEFHKLYDNLRRNNSNSFRLADSDMIYMFIE